MATVLPTLKVRSVEWVLWLPAVVIAVGYIVAKISPFSWLLLVGLGLTPLARRTFLADPKLWEVASALYLLFFWVDVFFVSRHMGIALTHLLTFLIIARSWTPDTPRTVGQRLGLVFALWVVIGAANNDAYYMSVSLAALVAFLWALMAFQVWRDGTPEEPAHRLGPLAVGMTLGVAVLGALIFLVLPRPHFGFLYTDRMALPDEGRTGLSDQIDLGSITRLKQDASVAFRVYLRPGSLPPETLYWRGLVLDVFDGRQWRSSDPGHPRPLLRTSMGLWGLEVPRPLRALKDGLVIDQEIWPAGEEPALLHLPQPLVVAVPGRLALRVAPGLTFPATRVRSYTVRSLWVRPPRGRYAVGPDPWPSAVGRSAESWLSLPTFVSPAVRRLAAEWTVGATSAVEKAYAIEQAFHRHFRYTTANLAGRSPDPIGTFLTRTRAGYCEYFASAMVLMLRTLGVPARVVAGYHGGQWNDRGGFWEVFHQDAHAWVEAWDDRAGLWVAFDPTPPAVASVRAGPMGWLRRLREWQSAIAFWWDRQVILYSAREQWELGQGLFAGLERWFHRLRSSFPSWRPEAGRLRREAAWAVGLTLAGLVGLLWLWQKRTVWLNRLHGRSAVPWQDYYDLLKWVERWAGTRRPSETPMAYVRRAQAHRPEVAADLQAATRVFYDLRFYRASPEAARQLRSLVRTCIRGAPSKKRRQVPDTARHGDGHLSGRRR